MKRWMASGLLLLAGCATNVTPRGDPPVRAFDSTLQVEAAAGCLVRALDAGSAFGAHRVDTIQPGHIYEVSTIQEVMVGGQPYFARATRTDTGSRIEFFGYGRFKAYAPKIDACRT